MAKNYLDIQNSVLAGNIMDWTNALSRKMGVPVDITEVYNSYNDAVVYAATNPVAYEGQLITVTTGGDTTVYVITPKSQGTITIGEGDEAVTHTVYIKPVGIIPSGDGKSIEVTKDGEISLFGIDGADGLTLPRMKQDKSGIEWVPVSSIVEGDGNSVTTIVAKDQSVAITDKAEEGFEGHKYEVNVKLADLGPDRENALKLHVDEQEDLRGGLYVELPDADEYGILKRNAVEGSQYDAVYYLTKNGIEDATSAISVPGLVTMEVADNGNEEHGSVKCYTFKQGTKEIGHIDIPTDLVVQSGNVIVATEEDKAQYDTLIVGDAYIKLVIANQDEPIFIHAKDLVDIYTVADTNSVDMTIAGTEIKADVKISAEEGNTLEIKEDGLYVNVPEYEVPGLAVTGGKGVSAEGSYNAESKQYEIAVEAIVSQVDDNALELTDGGLYVKHSDLVIPEVEEVTEIEADYIPVVADMVVNEKNGHQIDVSLVNVPVIKEGKIPEALLPGIVATEKTPVVEQQHQENTALALTTLEAADHTITYKKVEVVSTDILKPSNSLIDPEKVFAKRSEWSVGENGALVENDVETTLDKVIVLATATTEVVSEGEGDEKTEHEILTGGHAGLMTPEEKYKLEKLVLGDDGSVGVSGTINADNVIGLPAAIIANAPVKGAKIAEGYTEENFEIDEEDGKIRITMAGVKRNTVTGDKYYAGLTRSKLATNHIVYDEGYGEVYALSTDKLVNGATELILNGGNAAGATN